jgi:HlyD family secretion protein
VVSYTAVVNVNNPGGKLLPGMTATSTFVTDSIAGALTVPNAALRFSPATASGGATAAPASRGPAVWTLDAKNQPERLAVRTGLTDGQRTQVTGNGITDGLEVIVGARTAQQTSTPARNASSGNPFQSSSQGNARGPRGAF